MGLLDGIERLINEHGSAAILKERIDLANDKYSALEGKSSELEQKITMLEAENETLRLNLEKAEIEVQNLKKYTEKTQGEYLNEIEEKILAFVANHENATEQHVAQAVGVDVNVASFHLEELRNATMVSYSVVMGSDWLGTANHTEWAIAHAGRGYLITHGLVT